MDGASSRRPAKPFEPPPWEKDRFEELARQRAEQSAEAELDEALRAVKESAKPAGAGQVAAPWAPEVAAPRTTGADELEPPAGPTTGRGSEAAPDGPAVDEAVLTEMLAGLSLQEPSSTRDLFRLGVLGAIACVAVGLMLIVWGLVAFVQVRRSGQENTIAATVFMSAGMAFIGFGAWIAIRTRNLRGASK